MPVRHVTLRPDTVMTVMVPGDYNWVAIYHTGRDSVTDPIWATVNDVDPVASGNDTYYIPAGARRTLDRANQTGASDVRLLSDGACVVEVEFS